MRKPPEMYKALLMQKWCKSVPGEHVLRPNTFSKNWKIVKHQHKKGASGVPPPRTIPQDPTPPGPPPG